MDFSLRLPAELERAFWLSWRAQLIRLDVICILTHFAALYIFGTGDVFGYDLASATPVAPPVWCVRALQIAAAVRRADLPHAWPGLPGAW
jgi:hypothetical protein